MIHIIVLSNNPEDIPQIQENIRKSSNKDIKWHIFLNNCNLSVYTEFVCTFQDNESVVIHSLRDEKCNFSTMRAKAFLSVANDDYRESYDDWIMTFDGDDDLTFIQLEKLSGIYSDKKVVIVPSYNLCYPDKRPIVVRTGTPKNLEEYLTNKVFTFNWQILMRMSVARNIFNISDPSISHYDEALPQVRLYEKYSDKLVYDNDIFVANYHRNQGTLSNRGNYFIFMSDIIVVLQALRIYLGREYLLKIINYCQDRVDYILSKASIDDKPILNEVWKRTVRDLVK